MSKDPKLTIVIPTKNRWPHLERMLRYYSQSGLSCPILIGDSSDDDHRDGAREALNIASQRLQIDYVAAPETPAFVCARNLLHKVVTPYVALCADDDLLVPRGLDEAVLFLESNADYGVVHGQAVLYATKEDRLYAPIDWMTGYPQRSIEAATASERISDHLTRYFPTVYSVHRTPLAQKAYDCISSLELDRTFGELLSSTLPTARGKAKKLDALYMVRQAHHAMDSRARLDLFDWVTSDEWRAWYGKFRDCLAAEVSEMDGVTLKEAREVVKRAYWSYLASGLARRWEARYGHNHSSLRARLSTLASSLPGLYRYWQKARSVLPGQQNHFSLPALLRPSSPYHKDFMPIYRLITSTRDLPY